MTVLEMSSDYTSMLTPFLIITLILVAPHIASAAAEASYAEVSTREELITAIDSLHPMAGGTIRVRPGVYMLDEPLYIAQHNHVNLIGSGWNTKIVAATNQDAFILENCHFCVIEGFLIDQVQDEEKVSEKGSGIHFRGTSSSNEVRQCRIQQFGESGVRFNGHADSPMSSNAVRECHFIGNRGYQLWSHHNNDFYIISNQFGTHGGIPKAGTFLDHASAGTYSLNYHWDNEVAFILGPGSHYNRINTNRFEESRREGIRMGGEGGSPSNVHNTFIGNTIHTNSKTNTGQYDAVWAHNTMYTVFSGNQIFSWNSETTRHRRSLVVGPGCHSWVISDNIMRHHSESAILMDMPNEHIVSDNILDEAIGQINEDDER